MNGSIGVESTPGKGSTFWVTLRFHRQVEVEIQPQNIHEFVDMRVLIVDDNETSRHFLHQQIIAWRLRNGSASTGDESLAMLQRAVAEKDPYSVAIIDMQMPGDGRPRPRPKDQCQPTTCDDTAHPVDAIWKANSEPTN